MNTRNTFINKIKGNEEKGQSFIEFLLLFFILITFSFSILSGFNRKIGDQWSAIVRVVSMPNNVNNFEL